MADEPSIPRDALERVLARATELQGTTGDATEALSESRLLEVAREVGIDASHLKQALAEERARVAFDAPGGGPILDALGSAIVGAQRVVPGSASDVQARIDAWLPRMEGLAVRRRMPQRTSWEPRHDPIGNALRALGTGGRRFDLVRVDQLIATVTPVDDAKSVVRFDVELSGVRRAQRNAALAVVVGVNAVTFGVLSTVLTVIASNSANPGGFTAAIGALAVVQVAGGYGLWRAIKGSFKRTVARVQLRVDQLLDDLEQGAMQPPPSVIGQVTNALLSAATKR